MKKLTKRALLEHLHQSDKEMLVEEILHLFNKFSNVKEFYQAELSSEGTPLLERYKKKIAEAYAAANPKDRSTNKNIDTLLRDFRKVSVHSEELIDLLLYRAECGLEAAKRNPLRPRAFYNCLLRSFSEALKQIRSIDSDEQYRKRIQGILKNSEGAKFGMEDLMQDAVA